MSRTAGGHAPKRGPGRYAANPEPKGTLRLGSRRRYPVWDRALQLTFSELEHTKSVTHVLGRKCYLCA